MFFRGEGVPANNVQAYIVLKMAAVNGDEDALDTADRVSTQMRRDELEIATQVLGRSSASTCWNCSRRLAVRALTARRRSRAFPLPCGRL